MTLRDVGARLVSAAAAPAARRRYRRARGHRRLPRRARQRHVQLCHARGGRRGRSGNRARRDSRLRRGRGRRHAGQSDDRRRSDPRRRRARHRHLPVRGHAVRARRASRWRPRCIDYLLPSATEVPRIRVLHMETPSPYTEFGIKGLGEGGAVGPPAAIVWRSTTRCAPLGVEVHDLPLTPARILAAMNFAPKSPRA